MLKVVYIVTSDANRPCGVADYTAQLAHSLVQCGVDAVVENLPTWSFGNVLRLIRRYRANDDVIFHIQYPSLGMGASPAAGMLPWLAARRSVFVTLHEFELFNPVRKAFFLPFSLTGNVVFTNDHERARFTKFYPWATEAAVIPVGNNIGRPQDRFEDADRRRLVYFGQIAPWKGIEEFLDTVQLLRDSGVAIGCAIVGADLDPASEISRKVAAAAADLAIERLYDLSARDVSRELSRSMIALLPFPGGVSDKRGSALACLAHGLAVVTRHSELTPAWWRKTTYSSDGASDSARTVERLLSGELGRTPDPVALEQALAEREWSSIAQAHIATYQRAGATADASGRSRRPA